MKDKNWIWLASTLLILVILSAIVEKNYDAKQKEQRLATPQYVYSPKGCLYQVEFPEKPRIDEISSTDGISIRRAETAELIMHDDRSFVRCEFIALGQDTIEHLSQELLYGILNEYAASNGLSHSEFKDSESEFGKIFELKGYKRLKDESLRERRLIYVARLFFKENNLLIMYAGSEAGTYPTPGIVKFLNSVKFKEKDRLF